jgi:hypothetical protein
MAYPQPKGTFLARLAATLTGAVDAGWPDRVEVEVGLDVGVAAARFRRARQNGERELRAALRHFAKAGRAARAAIVAIDDVDLVGDPGDALLELRAAALELYAADLAVAFVVAASPGLFGTVRGAHEPLVRFFEPIALAPLDPAAAERAIIGPLADTLIDFEAGVVRDIVELAGGRPYYLQKLAYFAFDTAVGGRVGPSQFASAFERAFASVSQEIFAARWASMAPAEREVVLVLAAIDEPQPSGESAYSTLCPRTRRSGVA